MFVHGGVGTPVGASFLPQLPKDTPIVALQAPELTDYHPTRSIFERAILYRDALFSEWDGRNPSIHLVGLSFEGPLAFELAICMKCSVFNCDSLTLIDPVPYCHQSEERRNNLLMRAGYYDMFMEDVLGGMSNLGLAVTSLDILCMGDLEKHVCSLVLESFARELSLIVDCSVKLVAELSTRDLSLERERYTGRVTFFKADEPEFFERLKFDDCYHPDGIYGWSRPFPTLRSLSP